MRSPPSTGWRSATGSTSTERPTAVSDDARERLLATLRSDALVIGEVTLTSGAVAQYLVDAKRAILLRPGFAALGECVAAACDEWGATAVGGMTMGADPIACAALAAPVASAGPPRLLDTVSNAASIRCASAVLKLFFRPIARCAQPASSSRDAKA